MEANFCHAMGGDSKWQTTISFDYFKIQNTSEIVRISQKSAFSKDGKKQK